MTHDHGGSGRFYIWESVGPGVTVLDYDGDGRADVYAPQGAPLPGTPVPERPPVNLLFRNLGGRFTAPARLAALRDRPIDVAGDDGYGMAAAAGDFDSDGHVDLYVTNWGPNVLLRNNGDGTFDEITASAGVDDGRWSTAALWVDADGDGDPDLYVTNYLDASLQNHRTCRYGSAAVRSYCGPSVYDGVADSLFRNDGDGTFTDVSVESGIANAADGKGLAVAAIDAEDDGDMDLYVANDTRANFLYINDGGGVFRDRSLLTGTGLSGDGRPQAGMGIVWDDLDGDQDPDLVVTNFQDDYDTLYRNEGDYYIDDSARAGLRGPTLPWVGFGIVGFDPDLDGDLDLFVANGHIYDVRERYDSRLGYAQPNQLFLNRGDGVFREVSDEAGPSLVGPAVSRGAAAADLDDDGDEDLLVANNGGPLVLLSNGSWGGEPGETRRSPGSIRLRLVGRHGSRQGHGAGVTCIVHDRRAVRHVQAGGSFMSQGDPRVICALGDAEVASVEVRWPGGATERVDGISRGESVVIVEGRGVTARRGASVAGVGGSASDAATPPGRRP